MQAGILIIGSLLWDDGVRDEWRRSRLRTSEKVCVKAPIRYGRRAQTRGSTFTMVFARDSPVGQGVLLPCTAAIVGIDSLVAEAEALWSAEERKSCCRRIGEGWGCVGFLCREETRFASLLEAWACYFRNAGISAIDPVDERGVLCIPWPSKATDGTPADVDMILATATRAEVMHPCAEQVADAWLGQNGGYERYFFENILHGIRTREDGLIWKRMQERRPSWLENDAYAEAVAILRREEPAEVQRHGRYPGLA